MAGNPLNITADTSGRGKSYSPKVSAKKRQSFLGNKAYKGEPDDGIERVYPEMMLPVGKAVGAIGKAAQLGGRLKQAGKGFMESPAVNATKRTIKFPKSAPKSATPKAPKAPKAPKTPAPPRFDLAKKFGLTPKQKRAWHKKIGEAGGEVPAPYNIDKITKKPAPKAARDEGWDNMPSGRYPMRDGKRAMGPPELPPAAAPRAPKPAPKPPAPRTRKNVFDMEDRGGGRGAGLQPFRPSAADKMGPPKPTARQREIQKRKDFVGPKREYQDYSELRQAVLNDEKFKGIARQIKQGAKPAEKPPAPKLSKHQIETERLEAEAKNLQRNKDVMRVTRVRRSRAEIAAARAANDEFLAKSRAAEGEAFKKAFPENASKKLMDTNVMKAGKRSAPKDVKKIFKDITGTYKKGGVVKTKKKPLPFWMKKKGAKSEDKAEGPMKYAKGGMVKGSRGNGCAQRGFK